MKHPILILLILSLTLYSLNCIAAVATVGTHGLIKKSMNTKEERQEFLDKFYANNLEREKAGLPPYDLCIAKYRFDEGWAKDDETCKKIIAAYLRGEIDEYGQLVPKKDEKEKKE